MSEINKPLKAEGNDLEVIESWWDDLEQSRGDRANLRRCISPDEVLTHAAFFNFLNHQGVKGYSLSEQWQQNLYPAALVCGLLSRVKTKLSYLTDKESGNKERITFAKQLAGSGERPVMSENRFQKLQQSRTVEEFYLNMCRAIELLDKKVNIQSLVEDVLHWYREFIYGKDKNPNKRLSVRWATDYFSQLH